MIENVFLIISLKYNLISISQLYDKGYDVKFKPHAYIIEIPNKNKFLTILRSDNICTIYLDDFHNVTYFSALNDYI